MKRGLLEDETLGSGSSYQRFAAGPQHPLATTPLNTELWHKLETHVEYVYLAVIWLPKKLNFVSMFISILIEIMFKRLGLYAREGVTLYFSIVVNLY